MILSAKNLKFDLDLLKLIQHLKDVYRPEKIIYFSADFSFMKEEFLDLENLGVEMIYKKIYSENNKTKANCDVEISSLITNDVDFNNVDKVILLSGDGDFAYILDFVNKQNKGIQVVAFDPVSCSRVLKWRGFAKISYLIDKANLLKKEVLTDKNEKPPAST